MKKYIILALITILVQSLYAHDSDSTVKIKTIERRFWFDIKFTQHIGLHPWGESYLNDGLPKAMISELSTSFNLYLARPYFGIFVDMGVGFMPAPKMKSLELDKLPMPRSGIKYYSREILSEHGNTGTTTHFTMNFGIMGRMPITEKLSLLPCVGIGFMTMSQRKYEVLLKEQGTNMQYNTVFAWNGTSGDEDSHSTKTLASLTGRLVLKYKLSRKSSVFLGLEYKWCLNSLYFSARYTNTFNANIQRDFVIEGEKMNMLGVSVGVSF